MTLRKASDARIAVVGLGYVGLPLALALAKHFPVVGYDVDQQRCQALIAGQDKTGEVAAAELDETTLSFASDINELSECNLFIVTVPTPINASNEPDLAALRAASSQIGTVIVPGAVVVYESTVYPGVTEEICGPELQQASGLICGTDFFLGYSPERINPGDSTHTIDRVIKVVAGQTPEIAAVLAEIYAAAVPAGVHVAPDIRAAEAAKVIENAQRDINIAFINEASMIFHGLGIDTQAVLDAARTKWNFLDFRPGLVGGHCIGVDPFYLAHAARAIGHDPEIVLSGRHINDGMAQFCAAKISSFLSAPARVLVLGLTFKENVTDLRNSKVADLVRSLEADGHTVTVHDTLASAPEAARLYDLDILKELPTAGPFDAIVGAVSHDDYCQMSTQDLRALLASDGLIADLKGMWRDREFGAGVRRWQL